jgi:hypothetical protein
MSDIASLHGGGYRLVLRTPPQHRQSVVLADLFGPDGKISRDDAPVELEVAETERGRGLVIGRDAANRIVDLVNPVRRETDDWIGTLRDAPVRIYARTAEAAAAPDRDMLERLGRLGDALLITEDVSRLPTMVDTPAAYTYFGQFLAHELTVWNTVPNPGQGDKHHVMDSAIDLKTIFMRPPEFPERLPPHVKSEEDLALGESCPDSGARMFGRGLDDLPRMPDGAALLFEKRNDQNLAVAQTHVAVTRFAQAGLRILTKGSVDRRRTIVRHFQSVVLQDYLARIVDPATWADVMEHGRAFVAPSGAQRTGFWFIVPKEFSGAIFKFGHAMRKDVYAPWNTVNPHDTVDSAITSDLLGFTGAGHGLTKGRVPQKWVTDWRHMLGVSHIGPIMARAIGTALSKEVFCLPERLFQHSKHDRLCPGMEEKKINLARRTLMVGADLRLPSGQVYAGLVQAALEAAGSPCKIRVLTPQELGIPDNPTATAIMQEGVVGQRFVDQTPLWIYTLREAAVLGCGNHLGPLGGRIVAESISAAVEASGTGMIVKGIRQPFHAEPRFGGKSADKFDLDDLVKLAFSNKF